MIPLCLLHIFCHLKDRLSPHALNCMEHDVGFFQYPLQEKYFIKYQSLWRVLQILICPKERQVVLVLVMKASYKVVV